MTYRNFAYFALSSLRCIWAFTIRLVEDVYDRLASVALYAVRTSPIATALSLMPRFKLLAFRILAALKPVYRESYDTNGHSLRS